MGVSKIPHKTIVNHYPSNGYFYLESFYVGKQCLWTHFVEFPLCLKKILNSVKPFVSMAKRMYWLPSLQLIVCYYEIHFCVEITNFLNDVKLVSKTYPGGVPKYIETSKKLISDSTKNVNPFDGFKTEVL